MYYVPIFYDPFSSQMCKSSLSFHCRLKFCLNVFNLFACTDKRKAKLAIIYKLYGNINFWINWEFLNHTKYNCTFWTFHIAIRFIQSVGLLSFHGFLRRIDCSVSLKKQQQTRGGKFKDSLYKIIYFHTSLVKNLLKW